MKEQPLFSTGEWGPACANSSFQEKKMWPFYAVTSATQPNPPQGIDEATDIAVTVSPNLTTGMVHVESAEPVERLELVGMQGTLIRSAAGTTEVDLSGLAAGTYLLRVTTCSGTATRQVVLQ